MKEAREMKDKIVSDAKTSADEEAKRILQRAQDEIEKQKSAAIAELKKEVSILSVQIAEKLVQQKLESSDAQQALIAQQLNQLN
jgi:F-type H+-transporting ATPase subunit b